ncbi:tetratricopeptide repeat protein 9C-like [Babylonia areolata]|uniref:tetratricopeptide repeat protein 9C-like n=1 Tax=Babylonia areolata TaxID=304850 RepID=UPI003FD00EC7
MEAAPNLVKSHQDYLKKALAFKTEGNAAYKAKDYKTAIGKYHRALITLKAVGLTVETEFNFTGESSFSFPNKMIKERDQLRSECYNNLAACLLTRQNPDCQRIVEHCEKVLEYDATNVKAAYRMGTALSLMGNLEKAQAIVTSQHTFLSDKMMQALLKSIQEKKKVEKEKLKTTYQKMFVSDSGSAVKKADKTQSHVEPILIKNKVSSESDSLNGATTNHNGAKLIHVASAEKEAAC